MFENMRQVELFFQGRQKLGIKPGLERIHHLLALLDHPQNNIKGIHIAGTNGKGSTINYVKNAMIANDYKVGLFTSPSLHGLTGYIFKNNQAISEADFIHILNEIYPIIVKMDNNKMHPTEFEIMTVMAFMYFAKHVDIALIEAGMGGREDTTNCFIPILSIITNIDMDHTTFLGDTLEKIAEQKAGIIKSEIPVVVGDISENSMTLIEKETKLKDAKIYKSGVNFTYSDIEEFSVGQKFTWKDDMDLSITVSLQMHGAHQVKNAALALQTLKILHGLGYQIDFKKALESINHTKIPGRFEMIRTHPVIILDGAHNPAGMDAFMETVSSKYHGKEKHLIFAGFKDKDLKTMIDKCIPDFESITLTSFEHPRAATSHMLADGFNEDNITAIDDWKDAIGSILSNSDQKGGYYFITGSLYFISIVRDYLLNKS